MLEVHTHSYDAFPNPGHALPDDAELHQFCVQFQADMDNFPASAYTVTPVLTAPQKLRTEMPTEASFTLIWDSGASHCVSNDKKDFVKLNRPGLIKKLTGLAVGLHIEGVGEIAWSVIDIHGNIRTFILPGYFVPSSPAKLLATASLLQRYIGETINLTEHCATLSGILGDSTRTPVQAFVSPKNNIPVCTGYRLADIEQTAEAFNAYTKAVDPRNLNLSEPAKELLRWHQRLCHLDYTKIQFLMRLGVLCVSPSKRALHLAASKLRGDNRPKCAACQFGKQTARPTKTHRSSGAPVSDRPSPVLKENKLFPGQTISVDHFVCSTKGIKSSSRGGSDQSNMYTGGCIFVDNATGFVHIEHQVYLNSHETLRAKASFEDMCRDYGVIPVSYVSDSGSAFTSSEFARHLEEQHQTISFAGTSAHHHNSICERSIRTLMSISRTILLHAATHWPDMADATLWPLSNQYAAYVFNRVPDPSTGLSPLDLFSRTRLPQRRLHDLHVWGCPVYLLDKTIADGKKLPRWKPRSERVQFVGISDKHLSSIPMVLNPRTRHITTPYHVVFDDWFSTVGTSESELPDFTSPLWSSLFGEHTFHYDDDGPSSDPASYGEDLDLERLFHRQDEIQRAVQPDSTPESHISGDTPDRSPPSREPISREPSSREPRSREPTSRETAPPVSDSRESDLRERPSSPPTYADVTRSRPCPTPPSPAASGPGSRLHNELHRLSSEAHVDLPPTSAPRPRILRSGQTYYVPLAYTCSLLGLPLPSVWKASQSDPDTMTIDQALADTAHYSEWTAALEKELRTLEDRNTWVEEPVSQAKGDIVPVHWVMKIKRKPDGSLDKFKARIVVRGDLMKDYDFETHAPTCAWSTIRMVLILSLMWNWTTCTCDYSNAFIHSKLDTPVWIRLPRGYKSSSKTPTCLRLLRSLYGTTFAPRLWSDCLFEALKKYGLKQSEHDPCLFTKPGMMACCFVDDLAMSFKDPSERTRFVKAMEEYGFTLEMDDSLEAFLGIKFSRSPDGSFTMTQPALIQKIIDATDMGLCNRNQTPASPGQTLGKDPAGEPMRESWAYPSVIGMLLYLSTNTRCDIAFAVSQVARFTHDPKQSHATAVKTIIRYLAGTKDKGTIMRPNGTLQVNCYSDADFSGLYGADPNQEESSAKSRMGYLISMGGCPLVWKSQLIQPICLATAEAEYYSLSHCLRTLIPIRRTLEELTRNLRVPAPLQATITSTAFEDNSAALILANQQRLTSRTRYYHAYSHHFWQHVKDGTVKVVAIETSLMDADYLTKSLGRVAFEANRLRVQGW